MLGIDSRTKGASVSVFCPNLQKWGRADPFVYTAFITITMSVLTVFYIDCLLFVVTHISQTAQMSWAHVQVWIAAAPVFTMTTVTYLEYSRIYYLANMTQGILLVFTFCLHFILCVSVHTYSHKYTNNI